MKTLDELKAHYDWLTATIATNPTDKLLLMADLEVADMELRARITEGISIERLMEMCKPNID